MNSKKLKILYHLLVNIQRSVGTFPVESGGILLGSRKYGIITEYYFDFMGSRSGNGYDPHVDFLNHIVKKEWSENKRELVGFVHSHPRGAYWLSGDWGNGTGDMAYIERIFQAMPALKRFYVPIVYSTVDGGPFEIFPYIAERDNVENYQLAQLEIIKN